MTISRTYIFEALGKQDTLAKEVWDWFGKQKLTGLKSRDQCTNNDEFEKIAVKIRDLASDYFNVKGEKNKKMLYAVSCEFLNEKK